MDRLLTVISKLQPNHLKRYFAKRFVVLIKDGVLQLLNSGFLQFNIIGILIKDFSSFFFWMYFYLILINNVIFNVVLLNYYNKILCYKNLYSMYFDSYLAVLFALNDSKLTFSLQRWSKIGQMFNYFRSKRLPFNQNIRLFHPKTSLPNILSNSRTIT